MALPASPRSRLFAGGIAMQDYPGHFGPIRAIGLGVEQAQIGHEMRFVVDGNVGTVWGLVIDIRIKLGLHTHGTPFSRTGWNKKILSICMNNNTEEHE